MTPFVRKQIRRAKILFRMFLWELNKRFRRRFIVRTKQGVFEGFFADRVIGRSLYCKREYEFGLCREVVQFLASRGIDLRNKTMLDIGANNGVISIGMIYNGYVGRSIAIEPDPLNFSVLQKNAERNGFANRMICVCKAASEANGEAVFELSRTNFGDHRVRGGGSQSGQCGRDSIRVQRDTIDDIIASTPEEFRGNIGLIWIDVQGHEGFVIKGGRGLFSRGLPAVMEICPRLLERAGISQEEFISALREHWRDFWVFRRRRFVKYPLSVLANFMEELVDDDHPEENIILI